MPDAVNPLGGTMVATPGAMGFGAVPPQAMPAPVTTPEVPATPAFGATTPAGFAPTDLPAPAPGPAPGGWGAPVGVAQPAQQPAAGGWGAPVGVAQPAQQPAAGGWGAPQPASAQQGYSPYGTPPAALAPSQQAMQPIGPQHPGYAMPSGPGQHGPIGKMRNPVMVVVLTYVTCGIYGMIAFLTMLGELKSFRQKNDISPILFLLPVISILELIKLPAKVLEAKRMAGVPNAQEPNVILYLFLGIYMLPADLNEIWQVASAKQGYGALPPGAV